MPFSVKPRSRVTAVVLAALVAVSVSACRDAPSGPNQYYFADELGFHEPLGQFNAIRSTVQGRDTLWWFDWRADGCSGPNTNYDDDFQVPCFRHDFNWKQLFEIEYYHGGGDYWNEIDKARADWRFRNDMRDRCGSGIACLAAAELFYAAVQIPQASQVCYDHYHWRRRHLLVKTHPNPSCK